MEGKTPEARENPLPIPQIRAQKNMETHVDLGSGSDGGDPAATKPAMDEPHAAAAPSLPGTDALPAALPVRSPRLAALRVPPDGFATTCLRQICAL
ncbi:hypothetical protein ZWY2020_009470 [Hordeum vulgare]|nr:hypothetical protein ZWY2020_009470 [Hordeum vulgare]